MSDVDDRDDDFDALLGPDEVEDDDDLPPDEENPDEDEDLLAEEPEPERKPLSKAQREIIKLRKRAQDAETRITRAEEAAFRSAGAVEALSRSRPQGPTPEEQRAEQERLDSMSPREQVDFLLGREKQHIQAAFQQRDFQTADMVDSLKFERLCEKNKAYDGVAEEVERRLSDLRKNGHSVERKILANNILGERIAAKAGRGERSREEPVRRQAARPSRGGSDVAPERSRGKGKTAADRLANVKF